MEARRTGEYVGEAPGLPTSRYRCMKLERPGCREVTSLVLLSMIVDICRQAEIQSQAFALSSSWGLLEVLMWSLLLVAEDPRAVGCARRSKGRV